MNLEDRGVIIVNMSEEPIELNPLNFNEALNALDSISKESFVSNVWVPSLKKTIKLKEISAKQQKSMIESAIDSTNKKPTFSGVLYSIVKENCLEEDAVLDKLTAFDKVALAFGIRYQISDTLKVDLKEDYNDNSPLEKIVKLEDILQTIKEYSHPSEREVTFSKNGVNIRVVVDVPKFSKENEFDVELYTANVKSDKIQEIKNIVSKAYVGEASRYVSSIYINDSEVSYSELTIPQKIQIIGKLPASLVQDVLKTVVEWKTELDKAYTVTEGEYSKIIDVNSILFLSN